MYIGYWTLNKYYYYINVCNCDMFSVVYVYIDHLNFCIDGRRYVCCSERNVVSNEPTSCLVQPIGSHCCEVMYFWCFGFRDELGFLNCDDVCMCVVNNHFELLKFVFDSVYVDLPSLPHNTLEGSCGILKQKQYDEISLTFTAGSVTLCCVCEFVVVPYVDEVVSVICVLLFVLHVCLLRECDGIDSPIKTIWRKML